MDLADSISAFPDILSSCKKIYMPVRDDAVSRAKLEQYEAMLRIMEYGDIMEKTETLTIPFIKGLNPDLYSLASSPLGDYVRTVL